MEAIESERDHALTKLASVCDTAIFPGDHLAWDDLSNPAYRRSIGCDSENPCDEDLANLHILRMKERYFGARSLINKRPGISLDPLQFEMRVLREHNEVVRARCTDERKRIAEAADEAIDLARVRNFMLAISAGLAGFAGNSSGNQGCCSYHGGICGCGMGTVMCCDNTQSPTCRC